MAKSLSVYNDILKSCLHTIVLKGHTGVTLQLTCQTDCEVNYSVKQIETDVGKCLCAVLVWRLTVLKI